MIRGFVDIQTLIGEIGEDRLLSYYFNVSVLPGIISAPYRPDNKPSLSLFMGYNGRVKFKDQARGDKGDLLDLLKLTWGCDLTGVTARLNKDLEKLRTVPKGEYKATDSSQSPERRIRHTSNDLKVKIREWRDYDIGFWRKQGVDEWLLMKSNTYPISTIFFIKGDKVTTMPADKYAYAYVEFKDGKTTIKIYQPYSDYLKWLSKHDHSVWDLWTLLPERGDKLVITSSRKDAMCIWCLTGVPATSLQGEGYVPKQHVVDQLKERFKEIYVLFDNDFDKQINYGREYSSRLCEEFGLTRAEIPSMYRSKDPSDLARQHGRALATRVLCSILNEEEKENHQTNDSVPF